MLMRSVQIVFISLLPLLRVKFMSYNIRLRLMLNNVRAVTSSEPLNLLYISKMCMSALSLAPFQLLSVGV